jgi:hypothetical protein
MTFDCFELLIGIFRYKTIAYTEHSQSKIKHLPSLEPFNNEFIYIASSFREFLVMKFIECHSVLVRPPALF